MIVDIFLALMEAIMEVIIFMTPSWTLPQEFADSWQWFFNSMQGLNHVFPLYALITATGILMAFFFTMAIMRLLAGLFSIIRGGGNMDI